MCSHFYGIFCRQKVDSCQGAEAAAVLARRRKISDRVKCHLMWWMLR